MEPETVTQKKARVSLVMYAISVATITLTLAMMVFGYYLKFIQGNPPIVYLEEPIPVVNKILRHGDPLVLDIKRCVSANNKPLTLELKFQDGLEFDIPAREILDYEAGCVEGHVTLVNIPKALPAGEYNLHGAATFDVNFLANRTVEFESQTFTVLPD